GLGADFVAVIRKYLEDLINAGLRQRLILLIKELNREEPVGLGGSNCERYVLDSRGALVEQQAVVGLKLTGQYVCYGQVDVILSV
ncbi:unnamed protein product, partial [Ilex paraguariensis]